MDKHLFKRFDTELNKLRFRLVKMGTLVQEQVDITMKSLIENNSDYAALALDIEEKVDKLDLKIEMQCMRIFALHQPVAMDLRLVLSAVSINDNLELVGDLATNIARKMVDLKVPPGIISKTKFAEMAELVNIIIAKIMDAFVYLNYSTAIDALKLHKDVDKLFECNFKILTEMMEKDASLIKIGANLIDFNRSIQFISRQAKCMAEELVFLVKARMIKHQSLESLDLDLMIEGDLSEDSASD